MELTFSFRPNRLVSHTTIRNLVNNTLLPITTAALTHHHARLHSIARAARYPIRTLSLGLSVLQVDSRS